MLIFFFVKYTATNEIYTYVPTLSLHAARPILVGRRIADNGWTLYCSRDYADLHGIPHSREELAAHPFIGGGGHVWEPYRAWLRQYRSEEHTSELQSLMRISYAVFCLKTTKSTHTQKSVLQHTKLHKPNI